MLAVNAAREDGFHNLVSLVAPTRFGDEIILTESGEDSISCNLEGVPLDGTNLVMKAAELFRKASGVNRYFRFDLVKKVPHGAGLGGGSSNGATVLLALNKLNDGILSEDELLRLAAILGSDCPMFIKNKPLVMRGRGEKLSDIPQKAQELVSSIKLVVFKPDFSINTGWAYKTMRENGGWYIPEKYAEDMLKVWLENPSIENLPLYNNMQRPAFAKFPALEAAINFVRETYKVPAIMSGSGSACFAVVNSLNPEQIESLKNSLKKMLGASCFVEEA